MGVIPMPPCGGGICCCSVNAISRKNRSLSPFGMTRSWYSIELRPQSSSQSLFIPSNAHGCHSDAALRRRNLLLQRERDQSKEQIPLSVRDDTIMVFDRAKTAVFVSIPLHSEQRPWVSFRCRLAAEESVVAA